MMYKTLTISGKEVANCSIDSKAIYRTAVSNNRRTLNDYAYSVLSSSVIAETKTYNGVAYPIYLSFENPKFTGTSSGNVRPWVCSKHFMMSATHYGNKTTGDITVDGVTMHRLSWISLYQWAKELGLFELSYLTTLINQYSLGDISMISCSGNGFSDDSIPYFMNQNYLSSHFWLGTLENVVGWSSSQATNQAIPIVFTSNNSWTLLTDAKTLKDTDKNLKDWCVGKKTYPIYSGDSGKPKYLMINNHPVVVSLCFSAYSGPDFIKCFDVIKAFLEANGDEMKVIS